MDHARHMSSPSPTSSFLFQHSDKSFKSNLLAPSLLVSVNDVTDVDDCFTTNSISNNLHNRIDNAFGDTDDVEHEQTILVGDDEDDHNHLNLTGDQHHHNQNHHDQANHCVMNRDSLDGVCEDDDVDGMHNMLSGSSRSSTTTMPLLSDGHSHNPFSRISLEEYSPLSLVDDNELAISPTSLACGSHHPFKTSLNNLKIDNLDGVDVGIHDHDDDVVGNDTRSMSPTLLSASTNTLNHNLWSNSSTAITNSALLSNSSTSFLLSHHHHHHHHHQQLNSLMQQLEPQSLDETPPPLASSSSLDFGQTVSHRPSSEPPPGCDFDSSNNNMNFTSPKSICSQSNASTVLLEQPSASKLKVVPGASQSKAEINRLVQLSASSSSSRSSRRNRSRATSSSSAPKHKTASKITIDRVTEKQQIQAKTCTVEEPIHSSKVHLQLNHHQKLKELQQRLFGTSSTNVIQVSQPSPHKETIPKELDHQAGEGSSNARPCSSKKSGSKKEEADSSAAFNDVSTGTSTTSANYSKVKTRTTPRRKSRNAKNEASNSSPSTSSLSSVTSNSSNKIYVTETAEPDTTTKTSDCIKLADLLASTNSVDPKNMKIDLMQNGIFTTDSHKISNLMNNNNEKRIQHIQLQVTPSLAMMSNNSLMQPISIQQQQVSTNGTTICSSLDDQVFCRPITVMTPISGSCNFNGINANQIKCNIISGNELVKVTESSMLTNWSDSNSHNSHNDNSSSSNNNNNNNSSSNSNNNNNNNNNNNGCSINTNNPGMNSHQIAIQVICQDGTSLVLPVSSATNLSGLSLASQNQLQMQAILGNGNRNPSQQQRNMLPLVSVANIVAQQQSAFEESNNIANTSSNSTQTTTTSNTTTHTSVLAASSPTLAALLDAGSVRNNSLCDKVVNNPQKIISSNLLRKLIDGDQTNGALKQTEINFQSNAQISLNSPGSLVTLCTTNGNTEIGTSINVNDKTTENVLATGEKRIKLDNGREPTNETNGRGIQTTFTLIEPQGLFVATSNDTESKLLQTGNQHQESPFTKSTMFRGQQIVNNDNSKIDSHGSLKQQLNNKSPTNPDGKQSKMTSSTGNRQVDPAQPFRCEHCNSTFTRLGNFTRHKKIHTIPIKDGQRFKCDVCSKSFLQRCDLARHLHIHRGTEPHRCNICGKGYIRHSDLVTHQRFHNKEKPFGCPHCSKGFCQRGDLNRHLRSIHLQMKPILCPCCNRKFAKQETLLRHLNTAHRGRPSGSNSTISEIPTSNYTISQNHDKQAISLVTNAPVMSNTNTSTTDQKTVASLQALQATLCKVQQSADPSMVAKIEFPTADGVVS